jgi:large subunit ribosomal protein L24
MKIKTNDTVKIISGANRGKTGKVLQVLPKVGKVSVEGVNLLIKNIKSKKEGEKGQRISFPSPVDISNLSLICPKCSKNTRLSFAKLENGKKIRQCKKCKEVIDP